MASRQNMSIAHDSDSRRERQIVHSGTVTNASGTVKGPAEGALRRRPVQRRSLERFERILDASAQLLQESGYSALTTREVARRAGVPIGTLYQFFPGKDGLVAALAARNLERYLARLTRRIEAEAPTRLAALVDLAVEEFVAMKRAVPGFGVLDFGIVGAPGNDAEQHVLDAVLDNNAAVAERLRAMLAGLLEDGRHAESPLRLRVAMECADAVLQLAFRVDPDGDPDLIAECKRVLRRYLASGPR